LCDYNVLGAEPTLQLARIRQLCLVVGFRTGWGLWLESGAETVAVEKVQPLQVL
jgi:hypothetical protein